MEGAEEVDRVIRIKEVLAVTGRDVAVGAVPTL